MCLPAHPHILMYWLCHKDSVMFQLLKQKVCALPGCRYSRLLLLQRVVPHSARHNHRHDGMLFKGEVHLHMQYAARPGAERSLECALCCSRCST
jgi:hypothetical protein